MWYISINKVNFYFYMNNLFKRFSISVISIFSVVSSSYAIELDEASRTVALNGKQSVVLSTEQVKRGKRLFLSTCSICHTGGITKTNPNVGLDTEALSLATPQRNISSYSCNKQGYLSRC